MNSSVRLVAFDLDDTLAASKSAIEPEMGTALLALLEKYQVCVISGGQISQFRSQLIDRFPQAPSATLARLHLMPTCGTQYYRHSGEDSSLDSGENSSQDSRTGWTQVYAENLTDDEKSRALASVERQARALGLWEEKTWGPILEDRGSQITFSALGQEAPVDAKKAWDPTGSRKESLRAAVAEQLPDLEVRSGGSTSVDITRRGIDKAYGIKRLAELTGVALDDMYFIGDRLDAGGNDYPVKALGVRCEAVEGPADTLVAIARLLS